VDATTARTLIDRAETARAKMRGRDDATTIASVEAEYPAMREAMDWLRSHDDADDAFRLASALVPFWLATKRIDDGDAWFDAALQAPAGSDAARARALYDHGYLVFWAGRYEQAERRFDESLPLAERNGDDDLVALVLAGSARIALTRDPATAIPLLQDALVRTEGLPDSTGRSSAQHVLGVALQMTGDLEGAREVMSARLGRAREQGNEFVVFVEASNLSIVERRLGHLDTAESLSLEALGIVGKRRDPMTTAWVLNGLAAVVAAKGDFVRAATLLGAADALLSQAGGEWPPDEREQHDETLATLRAGMDAPAFDRARAAGAAMTLDEAIRA
jgi:non-specific serine/threonine protein kinase